MEYTVCVVHPVAAAAPCQESLVVAPHQYHRKKRPTPPHRATTVTAFSTTVPSNGRGWSPRLPTATDQAMSVRSRSDRPQTLGRLCRQCSATRRSPHHHHRQRAEPSPELPYQELCRKRTAPSPGRREDAPRRGQAATGTARPSPDSDPRWRQRRGGGRRLRIEEGRGV